MQFANEFLKSYDSAPLDKKLKLLKGKHDVVTTRLSTAHCQIKNLEKFKKDTARAKNISTLKADVSIYMEKCALKIQKVFRGYLIRKTLQEEILIIKQRALNHCIRNLQNSTTKNFFMLGKSSQFAALKILNFMKTVHFLKKIQRIQATYRHYQDLKEGEIFSIIRPFLRIFYSNIKIQEKKYELHKESKLKSIKRKLAVLKIKKFYNDNKLSYRILRKRIILYKRKLKPCLPSSSQVSSLLDFASTKDQTAESSSVKSCDLMGNANDQLVLGNIIECASLTSTEFLQYEQERKDALDNLRVSYKIPATKEPELILPYLCKKDTQADKNYLSPTKARINRNSLNNPIRQKPTRKQPQISKDPTRRRQKKYINFDNEDLPHFTIPTFSSAKNSENEEVPVIPVRKSLPQNKIREFTTLYNHTTSTMQKIDFWPERSSSNYRSYMGNDRNSRLSKHERAETKLESNFYEEKFMGSKNLRKNIVECCFTKLLPIFNNFKK